MHVSYTWSHILSVECRRHMLHPNPIVLRSRLHLIVAVSQYDNFQIINTKSNEIFWRNQNHAMRQRSTDGRGKWCSSIDDDEEGETIDWSRNRSSKEWQEEQIFANSSRFSDSGYCYRRHSVWNNLFGFCLATTVTAAVVVTVERRCIVKS